MALGLAEVCAERPGPAGRPAPPAAVRAAGGRWVAVILRERRGEWKPLLTGEEKVAVEGGRER